MIACVLWSDQLCSILITCTRYTVAVTPEEREGTDTYAFPKKEEEEEVSGCGLKLGIGTRINTFTCMYFYIFITTLTMYMVTTPYQESLCCCLGFFFFLAATGSFSWSYLATCVSWWLFHNRYYNCLENQLPCSWNLAGNQIWWFGSLLEQLPN